MLQLVRRDRSVGIPHPRLKGIFVGEPLAVVDHLAPSHFLLVRTRQVVHGHVLGLLLALRLNIRNGHETIDSKVHRNDLEK